MIVVVAVVVVLGIIIVVIHFVNPQAEDELAIAAKRQVSIAASVAQKFQGRVVHAQLERVRLIVINDELARTALGHLHWLDEALQDAAANESTELVEAAHFRKEFLANEYIFEYIFIYTFNY